MNITKRIILFSAAFVALQVIDLWLTRIAINKFGYSAELNPLYTHELFVFFKLSVIFIIAPLLYIVLTRNPKMGKHGMYGILIMYVMICLNNLYWVMI